MHASDVYILLKIHISRLNPRWHDLFLKQVVYWEDDTKPETMGKVRVPWNQTSVTVSGLAGNTQYFLTVSAFNTAGTGPFLPAINVTTKKPRKFQHPRCPAAQMFAFVSTLIIIQGGNYEGFELNLFRRKLKCV